MAILEIENLRTGYGEIEVLWSVSLQVEDKGITALLGSNGAGKTTMLNCITGLQDVWSGHIRFAGNDVTKVKTSDRVEIGISMVPEGRGIFTDMTVHENLMMGAYTKKAREKMKDSYEQVYQLFPVLKERPNQKGGTLSGGEQQMLAVGRALMSRPRILICDEPSTGLSPKLTQLMMGTLAKLAEDNLPVFLIEQHVKRSLDISHKAYVIENGKITMEGSGEELRKNEQLRKAYMGI
ncbi:MAG: ABC transporter ATP-binding protein [Candidatus Bathyarchaeota archaeon]|jgi:branched-chain amino acid transport system ATP-binding protein|nr:ABC transporter ATP-binding protein [Candidatus Bathyarchaeota archaeon]